MSLNKSKVLEIIKSVKDDGRDALLESEGRDVLKAMGITSPEYRVVNGSTALPDSPPFSGEKIVIKVISAEILHKSDVGGVKIVANEIAAIKKTIEVMEGNFKNNKVKGYLLSQYLEFDESMGKELLVGLRTTDDFGPVLTYGPGGVYTEFLAKNFKEGSNVSILSPEFMDSKSIEKAVDEVAITSIITKGYRGDKAVTTTGAISDVVKKFLEFANEFIPNEISEFEVNPFAVTENGLIALDALIKLKTDDVEVKKDRPIKKIKNLLEPKSASIIGVSEKMNMGHIILNNFISEGFDKSRIHIVKPGLEQIEGCSCYDSIKALPEKVDLMVLCIPAGSIPEAITEIIDNEKAESMIVIPGGLEEKAGTGEIVAKMNDSIQKSRDTKWHGPVINGGNCLGIISRAGKYDTMFIPDYKKTKIKVAPSPVAFISQSGAFAVSRLNKLLGINPKYSITIGNQMDLTLGDYLTYLKDDKDIEVFSIYLEGFKPYDGAKFLKAAKEITESGRSIVFYSSGKTAEGAKAMASHTASIAGDYAVTRELCERAGIVLADNFEDFEDLTRTFVFLKDKTVSGNKLGVVSNAGCECVAASDNLGEFKLAEFSSDTNGKLESVFKEARIDAIVDVHNPVDLTPMAGDAAYEETIRSVMNDKNVDFGVMACIPLAPTLSALEKGEGHREDLMNEKSVVQRMIKLHKELDKAWVAVVDAGPLFDPMARLFEENGIPTFRTIDKALRLSNVFLKFKK